MASLDRAQLLRELAEDGVIVDVESAFPGAMDRIRMVFAAMGQTDPATLTVERCGECRGCRASSNVADVMVAFDLDVRDRIDGLKARCDATGRHATPDELADLRRDVAKSMELRGRVADRLMKIFGDPGCSRVIIRSESAIAK